MHMPAVSPSREVTRELLSEATANLRATFFLAEQEGFTARQVQNTTKLSQRAVTALCTLWNVKLR